MKVKWSVHTCTVNNEVNLRDFSSFVFRQRMLVFIEAERSFYHIEWCIWNQLTLFISSSPARDSENVIAGLQQREVILEECVGQDDVCHISSRWVVHDILVDKEEQGHVHFFSCQ